MEEIIIDTYGIVYCIENTLNGQKYIGQTTRTLEQRVGEHYKFSKYEYGQTRALYQAISKYGKENFIAYEIDKAENQDELDEKETQWINHYNTYLGKGYNCSPGGQSEKKNHQSKEISDKMSETFGGREFVIYDMDGNYIDTMISQTYCAKELECAIQSVNNCLKGIKSQVKGYVLIFKDEFSEDLLRSKINTRRKFHTFVVFDQYNNYIGRWDSENSCNRDTGISKSYIHNCLTNKNRHYRQTKCDYNFFYLENCPEYLFSKMNKNKEE